MGPMTEDRATFARRAAELGATHFVQAPLFGAMEIIGRSGPRVVLLGHQAATAPGVALIDWRTAPLGEAFLGVGEGEVWDGPGGEVRVVRKALLHAAEPLDAAAIVLPPRPVQGVRSALDVTLDAAQQQIVDLPGGAHALILGEAGFGKTTVALRRLESLAQRVGASFRAAVLVPTEGLRRLTRRLLDRRGVHGVEVLTWDEWVRGQARAAFTLPSRESVNATSRTITLKRHRALLPTLERYARAHAGATKRKDLLELFGDTAVLSAIVHDSGALHPLTVSEVAEHTHQQFLRTTEREFAHVTDRARLETLDGARLDDGTPQEDAESVDVEDYAVLFGLEARRAWVRGRAAKPVTTYDAIVIDEAQEFAPLELELIGRALKPTGSLTIAGDGAQQLDETTSFAGWDKVLEFTRVSPFARFTLAVNYRCPPDVTEFARGILQGDFNPVGPHLTSITGPHALALMTRLIETLRALLAADRTVSVAVICRTAEAARSLARWLELGLAVHLALDGDFRFTPGVLVTSVNEVKGLEFDVVVVHEADGPTFTSTAEARRALYVASTRASHQLVLTHRA